MLILTFVKLTFDSRKDDMKTTANWTNDNQGNNYQLSGWYLHC